jgi:acetyl esterase/lipase
MLEPISDKLTPETQAYAKMDNNRTLKLCIKNCILKGVGLGKLKRIFETFITATEQAYNIKTMDLDATKGAISPEDLAAFTKVYRPSFNAGNIQETKRYLKNNPASKGVKWERAMAKSVPVYWVTPPSAADGKVFFYIHGGGWCFGSPDTTRAFCTEIALLAKVKVLSVDYRLVPEHPHPAQIDDISVAYEWLVESGTKPENIVIGGESAGGHLGLLLLDRLKASGQLPAGAVLISPPVDLTFQNVQMIDNIPTDPFLGTGGAGVFILNLLRNMKIDLTAAGFVPVAFDISGYPPLLLQASTTEVLYFDALTLKEMAEAAGVDITFQTWDGMMHAFAVICRKDVKEVKEANTKIAEFLGKILSL